MTVTQVGAGLSVDALVPDIARWSSDLPDVDPRRVALKTVGGLPPGARRADAARLAVAGAAELTGEEQQYSKLAARLLSGVIGAEVAEHGVASFSQSISLGHAEGLIGDVTAAFVKQHADALDAAVDGDGDLRFEYFGLRTVYDRYRGDRGVQPRLDQPR